MLNSPCLLVLSDSMRDTMSLSLRLLIETVRVSGVCSCMFFYPVALPPAASPPNCAAIQIFIRSWDVDRSIEENESSLWCSCQRWLGRESVYLTSWDIPTISLANPRHLEVNYFTNLSKWHAIVPSVSISSPLFLNLRGRGSRRWVQEGCNKAWDFMFTQMQEPGHK